MADPDHIRNPIEWGFDHIRLTALAVGSLGHSLRGSEESRSAPLPAIRRIIRGESVPLPPEVRPVAKARLMQALGELGF